MVNYLYLPGAYTPKSTDNCRRTNAHHIAQSQTGFSLRCSYSCLSDCLHICLYELITFRMKTNNQKRWLCPRVKFHFTFWQEEFLSALITLRLYLSRDMGIVLFNLRCADTLQCLLCRFTFSSLISSFLIPFSLKRCDVIVNCRGVMAS